MEAQEASARFREADDLFKAQRYAEALAILDELDGLYPNTKNIMFPRASCLEKLGRLDEAEALCDALIARFNLPRAIELKQSIASRPPALPSYITNLDLLDLGAPPPRRTPLPQASTDWSAISRIGLIVAGVVLVIGLLGWAIFQGSQSTGKSSPASAKAGQNATRAHAPAPMFSITRDRRLAFYGNQLTWWGAIVFNFGLTFVLYFVNLFLTLMAVHKLPHSTWPDNITHCLGMAGLCSAIAMIPYVGRLINLYTLRQNYEFGFLDFLTLTGISLVTGIVLVGIPVSLIVFSATQAG